ncbi:hybrid sensor histidine kinase/response regulator transcription factor [Lewinella sp. 4G2]|uniref:hybrid sensor histidine kinase/response regulator transcription factor n=1 Tax=Lewinella sp. 4G2 TaxID=1803372 RepID=UPI0007B46B0B|nr:hybrid sensor histidine kinase/response regulator transcription factor [Lewinella sp. 4G2]OAV45288.1 hypothetical protein A3850_012640 [Lewinella sp. 4G2]
MLLLVLLLFVPLGVQGQAITATVSFDQLTVNDGLSHSDANAVVQDEEGFVWIGTNKGLDRFDGNRIKSYYFEIGHPHSLSGNRISKLYHSPKGDLWAGTQNGGLNLYDRSLDRFIRVNEDQFPAELAATAAQLSRAHITAITEDGNGGLWVGTFNKGLFLISRKPSGAFSMLQRFFPDEDRRLVQIQDAVTLEDGSVLVGTQGGLYRVQDEQVAFVKAPFRNIRAFHRTPGLGCWLIADGSVWFTASTGDALQFSVVSSAIDFPESFSIWYDSIGNLWIGGAYGLKRFEKPDVDDFLKTKRPIAGGRFDAFRVRPEVKGSLNSGRIHDLFEDESKVLWVATSAGGINKLNLLSKPFVTENSSLQPGWGLTDNYVSSILSEPHRNHLYLGTRDGLARINTQTGSTSHFLKNEDGDGDTKIEITSLLRSSNGALWAGTNISGLQKISTTGATEFSLLLPEDAPWKNSVIALAEDDEQNLWVATPYLGLFQLNATGQVTARYRTDEESFPTDHLTSLHFDTVHQELWVGTQDAGLIIMDLGGEQPELKQHLKHEPTDANSLAVNYVWPVAAGSNGEYWVGTLGGGLHQLNRETDGKISVTRLLKYFPDSDVESILIDSSDNLWLGGQGIARFDPVQQEYLRFDVDDGLQSNSFKVASANKDANGRLWFGGINGVTHFDPTQIKVNPIPPVVRITGLRILNETVSIGEALNGRVVLPRNLSSLEKLDIYTGENDFSLEFVSLHFANPAKHQYAYQLEGYTMPGSWVSVPPSRLSASFANLDAGEYTFRVKSTNGEGVWSKNEAGLNIVVHPPWFASNLARLIYGLILLFSIWLARRLFLARQRLKADLLIEQLNREKEREMNDVKLKFFTNVSHELRTPLTLILGPIEDLMANVSSDAAKQKIELLNGQAHKLLDTVNQLMNFQKNSAEQTLFQPLKQDLTTYLEGLLEAYQYQASSKNIELIFRKPDNPTTIYFDAAKMEVLFTNLVANALKYTPARGRIEIGLALHGHTSEDAVREESKLTNHYVELTVADNGVGIQADELDRIFDTYYQAAQAESMLVNGTGIGLSLVKSIVLLHEGTLQVDSAPGRGTAFKIQLPCGTGHLASEFLLAPQSLAPAAAPNEASREVVETNNRTPGPDAGHLLIVEDNEEVLAYVASVFEDSLHITTARDGAEAWPLIEQRTPDLIISDVMMEPMDGLTLCQMVKENPATAHVPVILLTARTATVHQLEGHNRGADVYLTKPFAPRLLRAKALALLANRHKVGRYHQQQSLMTPTAPDLPDEEQALLSDAMEIVEKNIGNPDFSVETLVAEMNMSHSVLYRKLKKSTGLSLQRFINNARMRRAAQLLEDKNIRIAEVAMQVGFDDPHYFSKTFSKHFGVPPSRYGE